MSDIAKWAAMQPAAARDPVAACIDDADRERVAGSRADLHTGSSPWADVTVRQAMVTMPKVTPSGLTVGEARAQFADDHVHMLLLVDGDQLRGTLLRSDLPSCARDRSVALDYAVVSGRTVDADSGCEPLRQQMVDGRLRRLAVTDEHGRLIGLLCLKRSGTGFCSDADVTARKVGHRERAQTGELFDSHIDGAKPTSSDDELPAARRQP